ncbi:hypothetical protein DFJ77DRAFT_514710 [Powellomyces hirtus]|nr:hypothetical protein DFJ77DRAFT_514710 [Powellomyces hirtus]
MVSASLSKRMIFLAVVFACIIALVSAAPNRSCNCAHAFGVDGHCYCGKDGLAVTNCVFGPYPDWPMGAPLVDPSAPCPDPAEDPSGFDKCIQDQQPQPLPNANAIARACVVSTNAKPVW